MHSHHVVILALSEEGMVQDLGPYRSGRMLQTDLLPGTAVIARADSDGNPVIKDGSVRFAFEGNAIDAANLTLFVERVLCAASRLKHGHPNIAYGSAGPEHVSVLARLDLDRMVITEILDAAGLSDWAGEPVSRICPPRLATPCSDMDLLRPLFDLPMQSLSQDPDGLLAWQLMNGQILMRAAPGQGTELVSPEDPGCRLKLCSLGLDAKSEARAFGTDQAPEIPSP